MNIIKGLMTKDLLQLKSYRKSLIVFIVIYFFIAISQSNIEGISAMLVVMLTLGFGMFSIATFNYDESSKADKYILTLPLTKKEVVLSKYAFCICSTLIGCIIGIILSFIITFIITKTIPNILDILSIGIGTIFGISVVEAIQIPCIYKWGAEKGRLNMFILVVLASLILGGISFVAFDITQVNNVIGLIEKIIPIILLIAIFLVYFTSYKVSCKIYSKREL